MKTVQIDQISEVIAAIHQRYDYICVLDSSRLLDKHSRYDALIMAGNQVASTDFDQAVNEDGQWKFGYISYEFKNQLEELSSGHTPSVFSDPFCFVNAELVVSIKNDHFEILKGELPADQTDIPEEQLPILEFRDRIDKATYLNRVNSLLDHIQSGNIYEVNFCQEFYAEDVGLSMTGLFHKMRRSFPAPFTSYLKMNNSSAVCNSPERFLMRNGNRIISQPIKGTAPRSNNPEEDEQNKLQLTQDPKERSENIMITDLVRNDLSKHAVPGSVKVEELCGVYTFPLWHQMISTVVAEVEPGVSNSNVIKGAFPMGSMTGAPKIRAMELIEEHEAFARGLYSGSIGYITPEGDFDFNVVIRTFLYNEESKYLSYSTGGAITNKSIPEKEYEECLLKAKLINQLFDGSDQDI